MRRRMMKTMRDILTNRHVSTAWLGTFFILALFEKKICFTLTFRHHHHCHHNHQHHQHHHHHHHQQEIKTEYLSSSLASSSAQYKSSYSWTSYLSPSSYWSSSSCTSRKLSKWLGVLSPDRKQGFLFLIFPSDHHLDLNICCKWPFFRPPEPKSSTLD